MDLSIFFKYLRVFLGFSVANTRRLRITSITSDGITLFIVDSPSVLGTRKSRPIAVVLEVAEAFKRYAWEEAEHAAKFCELLGECVWNTETNLKKRMEAEAGACEDKKRIATLAKKLNLDAIHDTVHEMCKDEARHGKGFEGLYNRYFKK